VGVGDGDVVVSAGWGTVAIEEEVAGLGGVVSVIEEHEDKTNTPTNKINAATG
jgi:hypothetical protein